MRIPLSSAYPEIALKVRLYVMEVETESVSQDRSVILPTNGALGASDMNVMAGS